MKNYRMFFLTSEATDFSTPEKFLATSYNLTDIYKKGFLNNPSGLGDKREVAYNRIGDYSSVTSNISSQEEITGELIFSRWENRQNGNRGSYENYQYFVDWCKRKSLSLCYILPNTDKIEDVVCRRVVLSSIEKTEINNELNRLVCAVSFKPLSPYYKGKVNAAHAKPNVITKNCSTSGTAVFELKTTGNIESPLSIDFNIDGTNRFKTLTYTLYFKKGYDDPTTRQKAGTGRIRHQNGAVYFKCLFNDGRWEIPSYNSYNVDLSYRESARPFLFLFLKPNVEYVLVIDSDGNGGRCSVSWEDLYDNY